MDKNMILSRIRNGLIISSQAEGDEPLNTPEILSAMAKAGIAGGAVAVRAERPPNVEFMKKALDVPIIGLSKVMYPDSEVYITPTLSDALAVLEAGADIIAMDATNRARPNGETLQDIINELRNRSDVLLMADISTLEEGLMAYEAGFDMISTTLSGYTSYTKKSAEANAPDMKLLISLKRHLGDKIPIIAEGRIWTSSQAVEAFQRGAYSVVIGTAITRPTVVTRQIVREIEKYHHFKEQMTIGIDLGGTRTAIGLISYGGAIHEKHVLTTPWESGMNHMVQIIGNQVVDMIRHTPHNIEIIGIAATGRVDQSRGIIFDGVPIIKDYIGYPLAEKVSQYSDRPVFVENDANAAALAEYRALKDRPERFVLITLGTGIGGGIVINGELIRGSGNAGEIGHICVEKDGESCPCGRRGCLEMYVSRKKLGDDIARVLQHRPQQSTPISTDQIVSYIRSGDPEIMTIYKRQMDYLACGIESIIQVIEPDLIAIGGEMSQLGELLIQEITNRLHTPVLMQIAKLGNDAGIIGAAQLAIEHVERLQ